MISSDILHCKRNFKEINLPGNFRRNSLKALSRGRLFLEYLNCASS